jgi:hypothetical protein
LYLTRCHYIKRILLSLEHDSFSIVRNILYSESQEFKTICLQTFNTWSNRHRVPYHQEWWVYSLHGKHQVYICNNLRHLDNLVSAERGKVLSRCWIAWFIQYSKTFNTDHTPRRRMFYTFMMGNGSRLPHWILRIGNSMLYQLPVQCILRVDGDGTPSIGTDLSLPSAQLSITWCHGRWGVCIRHFAAFLANQPPIVCQDISLSNDRVPFWKQESHRQKSHQNSHASIGNGLVLPPPYLR